MCKWPSHIRNGFDVMLEKRTDGKRFNNVAQFPNLPVDDSERRRPGDNPTVGAIVSLS